MKTDITTQIKKDILFKWNNNTDGYSIGNALDEQVEKLMRAVMEKIDEMMEDIGVQSERLAEMSGDNYPREHGSMQITTLEELKEQLSTIGGRNDTTS